MKEVMDEFKTKWYSAWKIEKINKYNSINFKQSNFIGNSFTDVLSRSVVQ